MPKRSVGTKGQGAARAAAGVFLNFRITDPVCQRLDAAAERDRRASRSDMARVFLMMGLEEFERRWQRDATGTS